MTMRDDATILHVDLDAFFASVEQLDDPGVRGKPVIVGGLGNRGVVSTASYEARVFGVRSAMPMARARKACPQAVFLSPRMARYVEKSHEVMEVLASISPLVEQLSIDEAFIDVAGARRMLGDPAEIAATIRRRVLDEVGLCLSVGGASTKFLAKLASDLAKPDGVLVIEPGTEREFLAPLPLSRLWGVGPATLTKLERMGLRSIGDVASLDEQSLVRALGSSLGRHLHALACNDDGRVVVPERDAKSIGAEETFGADLHTLPACERELVRLADRACARMRSAGLTARTVNIKIRFGDFETRTRARTLPEPTDVSTVVLDVARALLAEFDVGRGVRLLGVSLAQLDSVAAMQSTFDLRGEGESDRHQRTERRAAVERAVDEVRDRFGTRSVGPATLAEPKRPAPGDQVPGRQARGTR
ncbi:MAG: polymerase [Actinomycetota bacterium]|jgi:DNA polymerase-4|nr:polymerase [Actinomycetota bacterium]MDQ1477254.1 polymerase [Actinomycetota bacterium]